MLLSSWCQMSEAYLQTASSFPGSFNSPGRVIRGPIRAAGVSIREVSDSQGGSVIRINFIKKGGTFAGLVSCPILSRLCPWTSLGHIAPEAGIRSKGAIFDSPSGRPSSLFFPVF